MYKPAIRIRAGQPRYLPTVVVEESLQLWRWSYRWHMERAIALIERGCWYLLGRLRRLSIRSQIVAMLLLPRLAAIASVSAIWHRGRLWVSRAAMISEMSMFVHPLRKRSRDQHNLTVGVSNLISATQQQRTMRRPFESKESKQPSLC